MRVVVLGAGFGGLELTTRLSDAFDGAADIVLIDRSDGFIFGFSKLDVMFGRTSAASVHHAYRDIVKQGVRFVQADVTAIDPVSKRVETDASAFDAVQVSAGAERDGTAGARFPRDARTAGTLGDLAGDAVAGADPAITGGFGGSARRVRGARDRVVSQPVGTRARPGSARCPVRRRHGDALRLVPRRAHASRAGGRGRIGHDRRRMDTGRSAHTRDRVPGSVCGRRRDERRGHRRPACSRRGKRRWQPIASQRSSGAQSAPPNTTGRGLCYLEFGNHEVARVDVRFVSGQAPNGTFEAPSEALAADKEEFGSSRIQRWFGRAWRSVGA